MTVTAAVLPSSLGREQPTARVPWPVFLPAEFLVLQLWRPEAPDQGASGLRSPEGSRWDPAVSSSPGKSGGLGAAILPVLSLPVPMYLSLLRLSFLGAHRFSYSSVTSA